MLLARGLLDHDGHRLGKDDLGLRRLPFVQDPVDLEARSGDALASAHRKGFPRSLDGAPVLLPTEGSSLRRSLEQWLDAEGIRPRVVRESLERLLRRRGPEDEDGLKHL